MPSLKAIRRRISSVKGTQKITRAMKMVAAARLNKSQQRITAMRPYALRTARVLTILLWSLLGFVGCSVLHGAVTDRAAPLDLLPFAVFVALPPAMAKAVKERLERRGIPLQFHAPAPSSG